MAPSSYVPMELEIGERTLYSIIVPYHFELANPKSISNSPIFQTPQLKFILLAIMP
jgi:hypothetical protein